MVVNGRLNAWKLKSFLFLVASMDIFVKELAFLEGRFNCDENAI